MSDPDIRAIAADLAETARNFSEDLSIAALLIANRLNDRDVSGAADDEEVCALEGARSDRR